LKAKVLRRLVVAVVVLAGLGWLFWKTLGDTTSEPYTMDGAALSGWTLVVEQPGRPAVVGLQPPEQMRNQVYNQIFQRMMVSLLQPQLPMPLVLQREFDAILRTSVTPEELVKIARETGVESEQLKPVCVGLEQESAGGRSQQLFYAVFDSMALRRFRAEVAELHEERGGTTPFDPSALPFVLPIASSDQDFARAAIDVGPNTKCQAPLSVKG
jgi:hypothetical protein